MRAILDSDDQEFIQTGYTDKNPSRNHKYD